MTRKTLKYFSTVIVCTIAVCAGWWLWNYYMQSPWTRDGKVQAELVNITPEVSGRLEKITVHDNQFIPAGSLIFTLDPPPYQIAPDNADAALAKAQSDLAKADHEAACRRNLPKNVIYAEDMDESNLAAQAMNAAYKTTEANLKQAKWNLSKTKMYAPANGYITNLQARVGNYASAGTPLVALVDARSFYVLGYFEETKLTHIKEGNKADIVLYNGNLPLQGQVESIDHAINDQSVDSDGDLLMDVKPNVPWVRLAQRVPVRIKLLNAPADLPLAAGTTCTIAIHQ